MTTAWTPEDHCVKCGKGKPSLAVLYNDPYCSRACAEEAYGTAPENPAAEGQFHPTGGEKTARRLFPRFLPMRVGGGRTQRDRGR